MRALPRRRQAVGGQVVDRPLLRAHARQVIGERDRRRLGRVVPGGVEARQAQHAVAVLGVLDRALLEHAPELGPELRVVRRALGGELVEQVQHALDAGGADGVQGAVVLQQLARDVQRQVAGIDHPAHEAQVARQQPLRLLQHEHPLHVQLDPVLRVRLGEVERRGRGQVQQQAVLGAALDPVVGPGQRRVRVVRDVRVELAVVLGRQLPRRPRPQRLRPVDGLPLLGRPALLVAAAQPDRERDVVRVALDDLAQPPVLEELPLVLLQMQGDGGAARGLAQPLQVVAAAAVGLPAGARGRAGAAGAQRHPVGDDEGGVEADPELADLARPAGLAVAVPAQELARAGAGDGADVPHHLLLAHADAVVGDGQGAGPGVRLEADGELGVARGQALVRERLEAQAVEGVGGVGDQLAQEDLLVRVQGMRDQVQQLVDLGLEGAVLGGAFGHGGGRRRAARWGFKSAGAEIQGRTADISGL